MKVEPSHVEIRYVRGEYQFGRAILYGQLYSLMEDKVIMQNASLAQMLQFIGANKLVVTNAQAILTFVVLENGFAS